MRLALLSLLFGFSCIGYSQNQTHLFTRVGLNRVGVAYDLGVQHNFGKHNWNGGVRFYEPDIVFEKEFPGFIMGYHYIFFPAKKTQLNVGLEASFFYEYKGSTVLWLFDPKLTLAAQWKLSPRFNLALTGGVGPAINLVETSYDIEIETFTYLNYELSLGIFYQLGNSVKR